MGRQKIPSLVPQITARSGKVHGAQACGCPPHLDPGQDRVRRAKRREGWLADPSGLIRPPQDRQGPVGRLLTEHREDGRRGGPAGAVAVLGATVVGASIGAGGRGDQEAAAGPLEKQGSVPVPGEADVRRWAQATPAAQRHHLPFHHLCCWADEQAGC